jgi:hypothetical protein
MIKPLNGAVGAVILLSLFGATSQAADPSYRWTFADPIGAPAAYRLPSGTITVASVRTTNGCQTPFLVPRDSFQGGQSERLPRR